MINSVVVGSGGHAKVVIDTILAHGGYKIIGCSDERSSNVSVLDIPVLGTDDQVIALYRDEATHAFIALGDNRLRVRVGNYFKEKGFILPAICHPSAVVSKFTKLGQGTVVMAGAVINACTVVGDFCVINTSASVDHDCLIGNGCHIAPRSTLAGNVRLGKNTFMGAGSVVIPGINIGDDVTVGAGAAVVCDIAPGVTAVGVPARAKTR